MNLLCRCIIFCNVNVDGENAMNKNVEAHEKEQTGKSSKKVKIKAMSFEQLTVLSMVEFI